MIDIKNQNSGFFLMADTASELMTKNPFTIKGSDSSEEAIKKMISEKISILPVVNEENEPIGILSKTDLIKTSNEKISFDLNNEKEDKNFFLSHDLNISDFNIEQIDFTTVSEIMTPVVYSVKENSSVSFLINTMLDKEIHHVIVVSLSNKVVGIISSIDILKKMRSRDNAF